jgi:hypothetical protein
MISSRRRTMEYEQHQEEEKEKDEVAGSCQCHILP